MSIPFLDYLPCDLNLYSQKVLPAWQTARQGNVHPLRELIEGADHLSYWPVFNIPNPLPDKFFAGPKSCWGWNYFDTKKTFWPQFLEACRFTPIMLEPLPEDFVLNFSDPEIIDFWQRRFLPEVRETWPPEFFTTSELDFWKLCSHHLSALFAAGASPKPQIILLGCLFYTFCCQLPGEAMADCREIGNEGVNLWEDYMARTTEIKSLWDRFSAPASQPLADQLLAPGTYQEYLASFDQEERKRRLARALVNIGHDIMGFLDHEETVYLLKHLPVNEHPELDAIVDGCIRDYEKEQWPLSPELEQLWHRIHFSWPQEEAGRPPASNSGASEWRAYVDMSMKIEQRYREEFLCTSIKDQQEIMRIYRQMCAYWYEESEAFRTNISRYYRNIERMERVILGRFRYAVERGWGMIEIHV